MSLPIEAAVWGFVAGCALIFGAIIGYFVKLPQKVIASIMAFGAGVLISALCFELVGKATEQGGFLPTLLGFSAGVLVYSSANYMVSHAGAKHRKRARPKANSHAAKNNVSAPVGGAGIAIALGALIDGIPEAAAIGVSMIDSGNVALVTLLAIFLSNIPEGLSSSAGMKRSGKSATFIFGLWFSMALLLSLSSFAGFTLLGQLGDTYIAFALALAAGAILVMIIQTMIPEAFEDMHDITGPIAAVGFLVAYSASELL
ncbi:ZIP family metal transporter [Aliiglaciecola lipolytica]|uniref:Integral membrane protein n=1 Tax=Aliiglaciecola lipolytica E3 TaxID=1127673 RepID=K6YBJ5_9ALTE|nr:integral membrane protein [Aliiglaciecola lipolytica]GAC14018.1 integral membrane protein [Aliiglaciecola lipolytica E3]